MSISTPLMKADFSLLYEKAIEYHYNIGRFLTLCLDWDMKVNLKEGVDETLEFQTTRATTSGTGH
jgi:hypothetical protein